MIERIWLISLRHTVFFVRCRRTYILKNNPIIIIFISGIDRITFLQKEFFVLFEIYKIFHQAFQRFEKEYT